MFTVFKRYCCLKDLTVLRIVGVVIKELPAAAFKRAGLVGCAACMLTCKHACMHLESPEFHSGACMHTGGGLNSSQQSCMHIRQDQTSFMAPHALSKAPKNVILTKGAGYLPYIYIYIYTYIYVYICIYMHIYIGGSEAYVAAAVPLACMHACALIGFVWI